MVFFESSIILLFLLVLGVLLYYYSSKVSEPMIRGFLVALSISHFVFVMIFLVVPLGALVIDYNSPGCQYLKANETVVGNVTSFSWVNSCEEQDIPRQYEVMYSFYLYYLLFLGMLLLGSFVLYVVWLIRRWF